MSKHNAAQHTGSLGIYPKIFLALVVTALVPLLAVSIYTFTTERGRAVERVDRQLSQIAKTLDAQVDGWIDANERALAQTAMLPDIRSMDPVRQVPALRSMVDAYSWTFLASTIGPDGKNVARSDGNPAIDYSDRQYFRAAISGKGMGSQVVISKTTGAPALVLARAVQSDHGPNGVLMISSALRDVGEAINTVRVGRTGHAFLLDGQGHVIAHPRGDLDGKMQDMSTHPAFQAMRAGDQARVEYMEHGRAIVSYAMTTKLGWIVVVQQDASEAFGASRDAAISAAITVVAAIALAIITAIALGRTIAVPIQRLTHFAHAVSEGKTDVESAEIHRGDELGELARAVNAMRESIAVALNRIRMATGGTSAGARW